MPQKNRHLRLDLAIPSLIQMNGFQALVLSKACCYEQELAKAQVSMTDVQVSYSLMDLQEPPDHSSVVVLGASQLAQGQVEGLEPRAVLQTGQHVLGWKFGLETPGQIQVGQVSHVWQGLLQSLSR